MMACGPPSAPITSRATVHVPFVVIRAISPDLCSASYTEVLTLLLPSTPSPRHKIRSADRYDAEGATGGSADTRSHWERRVSIRCGACARGYASVFALAEA